MSESDTFDMIVEEGQVKQAKRDILRVGQKRFGPADGAATERINATSDLEWLERMHDRLLEATTWQELLDTP